MIVNDDDTADKGGIELSQFDAPLTHREDDEEKAMSKATEREHLQIPKETFTDRLLRRKRAVPRIISLPHLPASRHRKKAHKGSSSSSSSSRDYFDEDEYLDSVEQKQRFPKNIVRNQKYNVFTFLPLTLYDQFKYFYNLYFLGNHQLISSP